MRADISGIRPLAVSLASILRAGSAILSEAEPLGLFIFLVRLIVGDLGQDPH